MQLPAVYRTQTGAKMHFGIDMGLIWGIIYSNDTTS